MGSGSEIITLQFGHYSNFVGSHWWNIQEANFIYDKNITPEINHDVLWREGQNSKRETTFTPRLLLVDLKGSLRTLRHYCPLYEDNEVDVGSIPWPTDKIETKLEPKVQKNDFLEDWEESECQINSDAASGFQESYKLDDDVKVWSDYLSTVFHPRTINMIKQYWHDNKEKPFEAFTQGTDAWNTNAFNEDWAEKCRAFVEECDYLQGFQVLFDANDGFSGICCSALQYLKDEYHEKFLLSFPIIPSSFSKNSPRCNSVRTINYLLSFAELTEYCPIFMPLSTTSNGWNTSNRMREFPNIVYQEDNLYHSSGILASFLDSSSLIYRKRNLSNRMYNILPQLSPAGRLCLSGSLCMPFPMYDDSNLLECLENHAGSLWTSATPLCEPTVDSSPIQQIITRGMSQYSLYPKNLRHHNTSNNPAYECENAEQMLLLYLKFNSTESVYTLMESFKMPMKTSLTYPNIFPDNVSEIGTLSTTSSRNLNTRVKQVPVISGWHNCRSNGIMLGSLYEEAKKLNLRLYSEFSNTELESLDYTESLEKIITLSECYS